MTIWGKSESLCDKAREFYYEFLRHNRAAVPDAIIHHIEGCAFCQEEIRRLQEAMTQVRDAPNPAPGPRRNDATETLSRHFEFLDESICCFQVRPFLPELLISSRQIRIPTPITVHIDNCPECGEDLDSIRKLGLRDDQLNRLGLFYSQAGGPCSSRCPSAQPVAVGLADFSLDRGDPRMLDHVSLCPDCRARLYQRRDAAMADLRTRDVRSKVLSCDEVSMADLFDFVLPFGLEAASIATTSGHRDAVATHVRTCPRCMEKVQSLHRTLYGVAERADSDVCTVCRIDKDDENAGGQTPANAYRYPIRVQVSRRELVKSPRARWRTGPHSRIAIVATVVFLSGILAMLPLSRATGMSVDGIRKAVGRMPNVRLTRSNGEDSQPFFEMLLATNRKIIVTTIGNERTLRDYDKGCKTVFSPGKPARTGSLLAEESDGCEKFMTRILDEVFGHASARSNLSESQAEHASSGRPGERWSVYELTREDPADGAAAPRRWKVYLDPVRKLPMKIEYSQRPPTGFGPDVIQVTEFTYLTQSAMDEAIAARAPTE